MSTTRRPIVSGKSSDHNMKSAEAGRSRSSYVDYVLDDENIESWVHESETFRIGGRERCPNHGGRQTGPNPLQAGV